MTAATVSQQEVVVLSGEDAVATDTADWVQHEETRTPDLTRVFASELAKLPEETTDISSPAMTPEDVDSLIDWLRSDSLDWEGLARGDAWTD
jgi:hypothetical protein